MTQSYTFFNMLSDMIFNGNKVSGSGQHESHDDDSSFQRSGFSSRDNSVSRSGDFDPSDSAGDAFRSVFGDDN